MTQKSDHGGKWGKGKTDPDTWFKAGCKAGPGRPKGAKNQKTKFFDAFNEKVIVPVNGKQKAMTKGALSLMQLANKAASGDLKAIAMQIQLEDKHEPPEVAAPTPEETAANLATLEYYYSLLAKFTPQAKGDDQ